MKTIAYPQTASFFTLIIFFCENKLFQRDGGGGVFVLYCGNSGGVEGGGVGHPFLTNMENPGRWGNPR